MWIVLCIIYTVDLHSLINHLAQVQALVCQLSPSTVQHNLKDCSHQPAWWLQKKQKLKQSFFSPAYKLSEKCSTTYRNRVLFNLNNNYLSNINHITHQSKPLQLQMRYVCLKKNVYLWKEKRIYVWKNFQLLFCKTTVNKATSLNTLKLHLFSNSFSSVTVFQLPKISHLKSLFQRFGPWMLLC